MGEVLSYLREIIYHLSPKKTQYLAKLSPLWKEILSSPEEDWASKYLSIGNTPSICIYPPMKGILFVRAHPRPGTCYVLIFTDLQCICGMGTPGDRALLDAWAELR